MYKPAKTSTDGGKVDLNPMLDVIFILLIFFVVTATFMKESGIDVPPAAPAKSPKDSKVRPILIAIDAQNQLTVAGSMVDRRLLRAQLSRLHAQQPDAGVVIAPVSASETELLVVALDAARLAGIQSIQLVDP